VTTDRVRLDVASVQAWVGPRNKKQGERERERERERSVENRPKGCSHAHNQHLSSRLKVSKRDCPVRKCRISLFVLPTTGPEVVQRFSVKEEELRWCLLLLSCCNGRLATDESVE
jgi:hypothetical protein